MRHAPIVLGGVALGLLSSCSLLVSLDGLAEPGRGDGGTATDAGTEDRASPAIADATAQDAPRDSATGDAGCGSFARPPVSSFSDDFNSGNLKPRWIPVNCITETGGELVAAPPMLDYCHAFTAGRYHLTCDALTVKVTEVTRAAAGIQTFIYVWAGDAQTSKLNLILEGGGFQLARGDGAKAIEIKGPYDPVNDVWWRLRETAGELFFETSKDGATWNVRGRGPDPIALDDVEIALGAGTWMSSTNPGRARFDCFNVALPCP